MFNQYIFILVWIGLMAVVAYQMNLKRTELVCGEWVQRYPWWFALVVFVPIIWMASNRGYFADTTVYISNFQNMPDTLSQLSSYVSGIEKDKGFTALSIMIKSLISNDKDVYLMVLAIFQGISLVTTFRKYSSNYVMSIFLFVASADYISWMFNGLRQFMAVTIIFLATPLMLKKKYIPLLAVVLLASTMHQSALLMIPFILIAQGKAWNKRTMFFILLIVLSAAFVGQFTNLLDSALESTQYVNVVSDYTSAGDDGTNPFRVLVYSVPAILSFIGRRHISESNNKLINFCTNMSIISAGLYFISMFTSGIFLGRLPIYVSLYGYILLPWLVKHLFHDEPQKVVYMAMVIGYLAYYYMQMHMTWGLF